MSAPAVTGALIALLVKLLEDLEMGFHALWFRTEALSPLRVFGYLEGSETSTHLKPKVQQFLTELGRHMQVFERLAASRVRTPWDRHMEVRREDRKRIARSSPRLAGLDFLSADPCVGGWPNFFEDERKRDTEGKQHVEHRHQPGCGDF